MDANVGSGNRSGTTSGTRKPDPRIGTLVAERYRILEVLGRGGMGVVYKAKHEMMGRTVAIKMLLPQLLSDENAAPRFEREAKAASKINHPNIISLHDYGQVDDEIGTPYLVMDYIEGESLADVLKREGQLGVTRTAHIFLQVCDALAHAHELGIIHRDLKPGNIMLLQKDDEKDIVKVVDFGVAKMYEAGEEGEQQRLTSTGELFGSPVYMSPEQCQGVELTPQSDVYSVGCVLYECITGKLPLVGKTVLETIAKQMNGRPLPISEARPDLYIPEWLELCIFRAMEKDPKKRQANMRELQNDLALGLSTNTTSQMKALNNSSSIKLLAITPEQARAEAQKRTAAQRKATASGGWMKWAIAAVVLVAVLAGGGFALSVMHQNKAPQEPQRSGDEETSTQPAEKQPVAEKQPEKQPVTVEPPKPVTPTKPETIEQATTPIKPVALQIKKPVTKPPIKAIKPTAKPVVTAIREVIKEPITKKHVRDWHDIARKQDRTYGDAQDLPVKPYGE